MTAARSTIRTIVGAPTEAGAVTARCIVSAGAASWSSSANAAADARRASFIGGSSSATTRTSPVPSTASIRSAAPDYVLARLTGYVARAPRP